MTHLYSVILTYKGKVLLFSRDIHIDRLEKNLWDFLRIGDLTNKNAISLQKEMNLPAKLMQNEVNLSQVIPFQNIELRLFHFRLTDENVNNINRKEGWRLEFYRFNELDKITLSSTSKIIFKKYKSEIKALIMS